MIKDIVTELIGEKETRNWIQKNLISSDDEMFDVYEDFEIRKSKFEIETVLYSVSLVDSFLLAVIDGSVPAADFRYVEMMRVIHQLCSAEQCYWAHITEPDNACSVVEEVRAHDWSLNQVWHLEKFELSPAAEGGCSYLCLIPKSKSWLLVHELFPGNDFTIALHSTEKFSIEMLKLLKISASKDYRD